MGARAVGRVAGRTAIVTGAGRGIGRRIALALAANGATLALAARTIEQVEDAAAEIRDAGGHAVAIKCDITRDDDIAAMSARARESVGEIDIVVNCAGNHIAGRFVDLELEDFQRLLDVNFLSVVRVTRAFLPEMVDAGWGRIINIASTAGKYGPMNQSPYNSSKHAVIGLTRCLALELARTGVTVNAICPGFVDTPLLRDGLPAIASLLGTDEDEALAGLVQRVPMGRLLDADEIAPLAVYLASDESSGMTGQSLAVCGGLILV